ncbi:MAG TPA: beta-propeller fold lactonase family protein [Rhizomicrobium sp.]|nr:beta-propeller fold lactonase family protein [Rhizomicrobium sp.]
MLDRRDFAGLLAATAAFPEGARAQDSALVPFYDSTGPDLTLHGLDVGRGSLTPRGTIKLPSNVQYCWPHPARKILYVASSNGLPGAPGAGAGAPGNNHFLSAFRVGADGALTPLGARRTLAVRPIHLSIDHGGNFALVAYNMPSHVTVHRLGPDGTIGDEVPQSTGLDFGIYAHQVRATPSNRTVTLVTRGNNALPNQPEDPGAIKVFGFSDGRLSNLQSLTPAGSKGYGFGPRHLDFHPNLPFVYVSLERNNRLDVYGLNPDGSLSTQALFKKDTLTDIRKFRGGGPSAIHVHPNGRFVYVPNRGSGTVDFNGQKVSNGGYNSVAVFAIDQKTGEPSLIQEAEAHGFELRTFTIDPGGKLLIAASQQPMLVREGDKITTVSAGLSIYRIGADGKLNFLRKQDVDTSAGTNFWCGLLTMT